MIWIHHPKLNIRKMILPTDLNAYIKLGFKKGMKHCNEND